MILNKFQVYKILRIQINVVERKENNVQTETGMFIFSFTYAIMKQKVTLKLFPSFKGAYPGLLPEINFEFRMQTVLYTFYLLSMSCVTRKRFIEMD